MRMFGEAFGTWSWCIDDRCGRYRYGILEGESGENYSMVLYFAGEEYSMVLCFASEDGEISRTQ
jgi:hypothetical protein